MINLPCVKQMSLQAYLKSKGWKVNTNKIQGPDQSVWFLGFSWLGKTKVMLEAVIDKMQTFLIPKMVKRL